MLYAVYTSVYTVNKQCIVIYVWVAGHLLWGGLPVGNLSHGRQAGYLGMDVENPVPGLKEL
jgi:hypothetical protein